MLGNEQEPHDVVCCDCGDCEVARRAEATHSGDLVAMRIGDLVTCDECHKLTELVEDDGHGDVLCDDCAHTLARYLREENELLSFEIEETKRIGVNGVLKAKYEIALTRIRRAIEVCERAEGVEEDLFTAEVLQILRGAK